MNKQYTDTPITGDERETVITCSRNKDGNYTWVAETSIQHHMTKFKRAGWKQIGETIARSNGAVQEMTFTTEKKNPISFRSLDTKPRQMTEEQKAEAAERLKNMRNAKLALKTQSETQK